MKKRILLFTAIAAIGSLTLSSYLTGPATFDYNRTGAQASAKSCSVGSGCHGTAAGPAVTITVDSGTAAVNKYTPGKTYTIKIHGAGSANMFFGFEFASVSGTGAAQVQAGTASGFPANVGADTYSGLNFVEQHQQLAATSAGVYDVSFQWTAPATNAGNVTLYCTLNAVNDNSAADAPDVSGNDSVVLSAETPSSVAGLLNNISVTVFPNPATTTLQLQLTSAEAGTYTLQAFSINGLCVANEQLELNNADFTTVINSGNWAPGLYNLVISKDGSNKIIPVIKQ